jgi:hypothetical protein
MLEALVARARQLAKFSVVGAVFTVSVLLPGAMPRAAASPFSGAMPLAGIVPPKNPPKNLAPDPNFYGFCLPNGLDDKVACNSRILLAIDNARATEPLGALHFGLQKFLRLSVPDQLFAIADLERVSRGEPPMTALTTELDAVAKAGATAGKDPVLSSGALSGGAEVRAWGSNWAEGSESALGSDDSWMYDDGYGSFNYDCRSPGAAGCWGHRDNILGTWSSDLAGCAPSDEQLVMGAADSPSAKVGPSFTEIFVAACGPKTTGTIFTWAQAKAAIGI